MKLTVQNVIKTVSPMQKLMLKRMIEEEDCKAIREHIEQDETCLYRVTAKGLEALKGGAK